MLLKRPSQQPWAPSPYRSRANSLKKSIGCVGMLLLMSLFYLVDLKIADHVVISLHYEKPISAEEAAKENFIREALQSDINGPFDSEPLTSVCASKTWNEGLIITCDGLQGGVGNLKNMALNCVRLAIELGAELIIPEIEARDPDLINLETANLIPLSTFFDVDFMIATLSTSCPLLKVHKSAISVPNLPQYPVRLIPKDLIDDGLKMSWLLKYPGTWAPAFHEWLTTISLNTFTPENPTYVVLEHPMLLWPSTYESPSMRKMYGRILPFIFEAQYLAAVALHNLSVTHNLDLNLSEGIQLGKFMGAHLRTDVDAQAQGWADYDFQSEGYMAQCASRNLKIMYVASGSASDTERLRSTAKEQHDIIVVTKTNLLSGPEQEALQKLSWDQQALIDYLILARSSFFAGIDTSSFSWNMALNRGLGSAESIEQAMRGRDGQGYSDEFSWIFGKPWDWPFFGFGLWP